MNTCTRINIVHGQNVYSTIYKVRLGNQQPIDITNNVYPEQLIFQLDEDIWKNDNHVPMDTSDKQSELQSHQRGKDQNVMRKGIRENDIYNKLKQRYISIPKQRRRKYQSNIEPIKTIKGFRCPTIDSLLVPFHEYTD